MEAISCFLGSLSTGDGQRGSGAVRTDGSTQQLCLWPRWQSSAFARVYVWKVVRADLCGRAQPDSGCWLWLCDQPERWAGVPPRLALCGEWILIIYSDLNLGGLWGCSPLPRDDLILLLDRRPPTGRRWGGKRRRQTDALLKGTPEVSAIGSTGRK